MHCAVCGTTYQLDIGPHYVAARRWALITAPAWIAEPRARDSVAPAMDALDHEETRQELETVRPAFDRLASPVIRLPYNRPRMPGRTTDGNLRRRFVAYGSFALPRLPTEVGAAGDLIAHRQPSGSTPPGVGASGSYGSRVKTNEPMSRWVTRPSSSRTGRRVSPAK